MSLLTIIIAAAIIVIVSHILYLKKTRPVSLTEFTVNLIATILLICFVWTLSPKEAKIEYKVLLTIVGVASMITRYISYKRGKIVS